MEIKINKDKNNTYKIDIKVEKEKVDEAYKQALSHEAEHAEIKGFRKGKAPLDVVRKNVDQTHLRSHALNHLVGEVQAQVLKENKFAPIVYPRYEVKVFEEGKDFELTMIVIEKPEIVLGDYKKNIASKKIEKTKKEKKDGESETSDDLTTDDIVDALIETVKVEIAEQLIKEETDRMLSNMLDQLQQMGLDIDQYLKSVNKSADEVRAEYTKIAERNIKTDFVLTEIAKNEKITVTDEDVEETIKGIPDEKSRAALSNPDQKMYIKAVLLKNKTLLKLADDAKGSDPKVNSSKEEK